MREKDKQISEKRAANKGRTRAEALRKVSTTCSAKAKITGRLKLNEEWGE